MLGKEIFPDVNENRYSESFQHKEPFVIPVIEETATVDKQIVETGKLKIEKQVTSINEEATIDLQHDEYTIRRAAINTYINGDAPKVRYEGDTLVIPVVKEVVVKRLLLVEEVRITKEVKGTTEQINIPLRKETVTITRTADNDTPAI